MIRMSLRSFVAIATTVTMFSMPLLTILGVDAAEAQTIKSQPVGRDVAAALQQEQQASALAAQGRTAEAEALYKQSLATMEKSLPGDPILAGSLNNVAQFYRAQRRFPEAAELFNQALAIYVASYGDNHTLTATVINNLAGTYLSDRKFEAAEKLYRRGLAASEKLLGPDHYGVAISLDWLAQTVFLQGRHAEAESQLKRGIAIAEKSTGPESQLMVRLLDHLISVVKAQGRDQEANALKEQAERIIAKSRK
jgi:tetratricopeptide (TPR) repeat protein